MSSVIPLMTCSTTTKLLLIPTQLHSLIIHGCFKRIKKRFKTLQYLSKQKMIPTTAASTMLFELSNRDSKMDGDTSYIQKWIKLEIISMKYTTP